MDRVHVLIGQHWHSQHLPQQYQVGRLTLSPPSALRWSLRQLLVEWSFGCRRYHSRRLLHPWRWRVLAAEVWRWTLVDPPDPAGCGHHSNRRHRGAPWNRDNGWDAFRSYTACDLQLRHFDLGLLMQICPVSICSVATGLETILAWPPLPA